MTLADPACIACIMWEEGDPPCPEHGGIYKVGMICPACGDDCVLVYQKGPRTSA